MMMIPNRKNLSREEQLALLEKGDDESIMLLMECVYTYISTFVYVPMHIKDDIIGQTMLSAWRATFTYNKNKDTPFVTYAGQIAYRDILKLIKRDKIHTPLDEGEVASLDEGIGEANVNATLGRLNSREKEVVYRRIMFGQTIESIAASMGISPATVKRTQKRALSTLRRSLEHDEK